jgi:hypothetical protein
LSREDNVCGEERVFRGRGSRDRDVNCVISSSIGDEVHVCDEFVTLGLVTQDDL